MAKIHSLTEFNLPLPIVGTTLRAGATINIERWDVLKHNDTVKAWLAAGAIEILPEDAAEPAKSAKTKVVEVKG